MSKLQQLVITIILSLLIVGIGYGFIASLPFWKIKQIIVMNNNNIPEQKIIAASGVEIDQSGLLQISVRKINENIKQEIDQIEEVLIKKKFPDTLILNTRLRKPIIKVFLHNTTEYFDGEAIRITDYQGNVPLLVDVPPGREQLKDKIIRNSEVLAMISGLSPSLNIAIYQLNQSSLRFNIEDTPVRFGDLSNQKKKLENLKILIDNSDIQQMEYIDLRVPENIAVKRR